MRPIIVFSFLIATTPLVACGGRAPDLPRSSDVIVTVTPSIATVRPGGTVILEGKVTGLTDPWTEFWIQEQFDAGLDAPKCDPSHPDWYAGCRFGYLIGGDLQTSASAVALYHVPHAQGTYHVSFRAFQLSKLEFDWIEKRSTATIVVTDQSL
jgi:hypothetical protein